MVYWHELMTYIIVLFLTHIRIKYIITNLNPFNRNVLKETFTRIHTPIIIRTCLPTINSYISV